MLSPAVGPTVDDLASALVAQKGRNATAPTDVTLGGYPAKQVELSISADLDGATCDEGVIRTWVAPGEDPALVNNPENLGMHPGQLNVVYIVDVNDERLVIDTWHMPRDVRGGPGGARCHPGLDAHRKLTVQRVERQPGLDPFASTVGIARPIVPTWVSQRRSR